MKNALLIGCGSKFGAAFTKNLADNNYQIDLISSSDLQYKNTNTIHYEWYEPKRGREDNEDKMTVEFHRNLLSNILFSLREKNYDLILFNQNSGQLLNFKVFLKYNLNKRNLFDLDDWVFNLDDWVSVWSLRYWFGCQLPLYISAYLNNNKSILPDTKVVWMSSGIIESPASADENWVYQDYIGLKVHNLHIMKELAYSSKTNNINGIYFGYQGPHLVIEEYEKVANIMRINIENLEKDANGCVVIHHDSSYKMLSHFLG